MCPLSQAEITCLRISFPLGFWDTDGHMRNSWMWRCFHVYALKVGVGIRYSSLCHWSAGSPGSVRGTAWAHSSSFSGSKSWAMCWCHSMAKGPASPAGQPSTRLELLWAQTGCPCEVQLSRWVLVSPGSWPHSYFLPNYHCHRHKGTSGSAQDAEKAAWHAHSCTQSKPFTECFIPHHSQSSAPLIHSCLIRTIHLWKTLGLFNAIGTPICLFQWCWLTEALRDLQHNFIPPRPQL